MNNTRSGKNITQLSGHKAFIPAPLPPIPPIELGDELNFLLSQANLSLGKLSGLTSIIIDPNLFVYIYIRKEALLSSQIEGTQCSLEDILTTDPDPDAPINDIKEVSNYVKAMGQGLERLNEIPVCTRLIKEMHQVLMSGVRGENKTPGEFRKSQNWIGRPGATLNDADFVPPPQEIVNQLMGDLENFIHTKDNIPLLIKAALIHAQFETIHPFLDGNGRLGRLLITYLLCHWKILDKPLLYLSYYFKAHRSEYYARLMEVRFKGDWENWITFFLRAVKESADIANATAIDIFNLHNKDRERIQNSKATKFTLKIYHDFCHNPILSNKDILTRVENSTKPKIQRTLTQLQSLGIISEISGKMKNRKYAYSEYLKILTRDINIHD